MSERQTIKSAELHVTILAPSYQALLELSKVFHVDLVYRTAKEHNKKRYSVDAFIFREQLDELKKSGYEIEILTDLATRPDPRDQVSKTNRFQKQLEQLRKKQGGN